MKATQMMFKPGFDLLDGDRRDVLIVVRVPLVVAVVLEVGRVVATAQTAVVVGNSVQIVLRLAVRRRAELIQVQALDGEVDQSVDLRTQGVSSFECSGSHSHLVAEGARVIEALEMNNEHLGQAIQVELLGRLAELLAVAAVPRVGLAEGLRGVAQKTRQTSARGANKTIGHLLSSEGADAIGQVQRGLRKQHVSAGRRDVQLGDTFALPSDTLADASISGVDCSA